MSLNILLIANLFNNSKSSLHDQQNLGSNLHRVRIANKLHSLLITLKLLAINQVSVNIK